jgi:sugar/nucleoside kinase (ribokinase family)
MIVVVGRPAIATRSAPGPGDDTRARPAGIVAGIAVAAAERGSQVEIVGTVGDDDDGDALTVALSRSGVGHAALLRDPAADTPRAGTSAGEASADESPAARSSAGEASAGEPMERAPRLEAADVELGLRYHADYRVLVLAEPLAEDAENVALDAASFQGAAVVAVVPPGAPVGERLANAGTVLEAPDGGAGAFPDLVGRYAAALDAGQDPSTAFSEARRATGWQSGPA